MHGLSDRSFLRAARERIAVDGIRGLSMRTVAQGAEESLGSLNYHVGDKPALIAALIADGRAEADGVHDVWRERGGRVDLSDPGTLAHLVTAYIDEAANERRTASLTGCEILLAASADPATYATFGTVLDAEDAFWTGLLRNDCGASAGTMGRAIAAYCRDELPFSIAAAGNSDYRLLRAATIGRLSVGLMGDGDALSARFDALIAACGTDSASAPLPVDLPEGSKKAAIARHIADAIGETGVASITHRMVASRAGIPNSSVAHHFRTRADLLDAGMGALILAMREELNGADRIGDARRGPAVIRATHSIALAAARDPGLRPVALDMRRRRGENVRGRIAAELGIDGALDGAAVQAAVMVLIGSGLAVQACGGVEADALSLAQLATLRKGRR